MKYTNRADLLIAAGESIKMQEKAGIERLQRQVAMLRNTLMAVAALQHARHNIASGRNTYICKALPDTDAGNQIRKYIRLALENRTILRIWLIDIMGVKEYDFMNLEGFQKLQATRLAWIDFMIELWRNEP